MITYRVLYNDSQGLKILIPAFDTYRDAVQFIAEKDIPAGLKFKVVETSTLPTDRTYRNAWTYEITDENKDGVGLTKDQFYAKYPDFIGWAVQ